MSEVAGADITESSESAIEDTDTQPQASVLGDAAESDSESSDSALGGESADDTQAGGDAQSVGQGEGESDGESEAGAPEAYAEFSLPDGYESNGEFLNEFAARAKADNLSQEQAQAYVDIASKVAEQAAQSAIEGQLSQWKEQQEAWASELRTSEDLGGAKMDATNADARLGLQRLVTNADELNALRDWLNDTGVGNHPTLVRAFSNAGRLFREDGFSRGGAAARGQSLAEKMYPNQGSDTS